MTDSRLVVLMDLSDGSRVEITEEDVPLRFMTGPGNVVTLEDPEAVHLSLSALVALNPGGVILLKNEIYWTGGEAEDGEEWKLAHQEEEIPPPRESTMHVMARHVVKIGTSLVE